MPELGREDIKRYQAITHEMLEGVIETLHKHKCKVWEMTLVLGMLYVSVIAGTMEEVEEESN